MYTYKLLKSNATPVLSSRAHLGAHKRAAPFREEANRGMLVWGGEGGKGGRRGAGGGEGGAEGEVGRILVFPSHRQPKSIQGGETSPPDLETSFMGSHRGPPPPPPTMVSLRGGGHCGGD